MLKIICVLNAIIVVSGLVLKTPTVTYSVQETLLTNKNSFALELRKNNELKTIEESKFNELIESIKLASGDNSKIKTVQWKYEISQVLGVLKVLLVDATIDSSTIKFVINGARVNQEIPIVYKTIQQCRPGSYLSCSRGTNCHVRSFNDCQDVDVPRGLTEDELSQIINSLNSKIPEIVKKITQ
jgi:asparagine synthetase B (glutamine-hydrolysing)